MKIVLAGAGHTHIELLRKGSIFLKAGHELVLISPEVSHPYSGMAPAVLGGSCNAEEIMLPAADLASRAGVLFVKDRIKGADPDKRVLLLEDGGEFSYDLLSLNVGSETSRPPLGLGGNMIQLYSSKPIASLLDLKAAMERVVSGGGMLRIAVIGGGPAGVEIAGNISASMKQNVRVDLYMAASSGPGGYHGKAERYITSILERRGVRIHKGRRINLEEGFNELDADAVIFATGIKPPDMMQNLRLPLGEDGAVKVNSCLQVEGYPGIFAVGDCASFYSPRQGRCLERIGVYAVRQQAILQYNLLALASGKSEGTSLKPFEKDGPALTALNLGGGVGILRRGRFCLKGRAAFCIKDFIDRRFMAKYKRYHHV